MTKEEAQRIYEECGSYEELGKHLGRSRSEAYKWGQQHGVVSQKQWRRNPKFTARMAARRACTKTDGTREYCDSQQRKCVIKDLPGSCEMCANHASLVAGISSLGWGETYAVEGI